MNKIQEQEYNGTLKPDVITVINDDQIIEFNENVVLASVQVKAISLLLVSDVTLTESNANILDFFFLRLSTLQHEIHHESLAVFDINSDLKTSADWIFFCFFHCPVVQTGALQ